MAIIRKEGTISGVDRGLGWQRGDHTVGQPRSGDLVHAIVALKDGRLAPPESH